MQTPDEQPRRLLMTADTVGGVWSYALELARSLEPHGVKIGLATMGAPLSASQRDAVAKCRNVVVFESSYRLEWMDDPWCDVDLAGEWLLEIAAEFAPDLVHINGYAHAALPWQRPVLVAAHSCVLSWWRAVKGEAAPSDYDEYARRVRDGVAAADVLVAPSRAMLAAVQAEYGMARDARVIPNAVAHESFTPALKQPFVFGAGRVWDEAKSLIALDRAAAHVAWRVLIAGDTNHANGKHHELEHAESLGNVSREQIAQWLGRAAIFAAPARYEPFGLAPLEAGLCACALVLGDIASLREIWDGAALFVPPNDERALASAVNYLIEHGTVREELGLRARARALQFSPGKMAQAYLAAYRDCMATSAAEVPA